MAVITTRRTLPTLRQASAWLRAHGYTNVGTCWLRGAADYARVEHLGSGHVRIIEGAA